MLSISLAPRLTKQQLKMLNRVIPYPSCMQTQHSIPIVQKIHFNAPYTTIIWKDGTHTVVKCADDDTFNPRVGFLYAYAKKCFGKSGRQFARFMQSVEDNYQHSLKKNKQGGKK